MEEKTPTQSTQSTQPTQEQQPNVFSAPANPVADISQKSLAALNAISMALSSLFGIFAIFKAIADFTRGEWLFSVPFFGIFNESPSSTLYFGVIAILLAVIALITSKKITDAKAVGEAHKVIAPIFYVISALVGASLITIVFYSLFALGAKSVDQGSLWLNNFLPAFILTGVVFAVAFISSKIAAGKIALANILKFVSLGAAGVGLILAVISTLVGFYGKTSSSSIYDSVYDDYSDVLNDYSNYFNF